MARLQILHLPSLIDEREIVTPRFALVVDQAADGLPDTDELNRFAATIGASGAYVTGQHLDVHQSDEQLFAGELASEIAGVVRTHIQERVDAAGTAVSASTVERLQNLGLLPKTPEPVPAEPAGRAARTWGAPKEDPRG